MKLVVFAHTPPPYHGQSLMVQVLLTALGGDRRCPPPGPVSAGASLGIECYHVNARLSTSLEDIGRPRWGKLFRLLGYCAQAVWLRVRHGVDALYYVPAPPKRSALYRDWLVMLCCRPFFKHLIFHWHGVGLGEWLEQTAGPVRQRFSHALLDRPDLAIILSTFNEADAQKFRPRRVRVVANGRADPCPDFEETLAPVRLARALARRRLQAGQPLTEAERSCAGAHPDIMHVLFLAHCTRDKGLFDAVEGVRSANEQLAARGSPLSLKLTVVGGFLAAKEKAEFDQLAAAPSVTSWLRYLGFTSEPEKWALFREADAFCFPTYFAYEGQPMNLIEAMAFGMPVVTTRWRSIPEFMPPGYPGLVEPRQPPEVAGALLAVLAEDGRVFREVFLQHFTLQQHVRQLAEALRSVPGD